MNDTMNDTIPDRARPLLQEERTIYERANRHGLRASDAARLQIIQDELASIFAPDAPPDPHRHVASGAAVAA
jgi:hypothetical protein